MKKLTLSFFKVLSVMCMLLQANQSFAVTEEGKGKILIVASSPATATNGWTVGAWLAEISHPYEELVHAGYSVDIVSTDGGEIVIDAYSDPRHESGFSAKDIVSLGFLTSPITNTTLNNSPAISTVKASEYDAIVVAGGIAPMFTYRGNKTLEKIVMDFYYSGKPTAILCHGVAVLVDIKLPDNSYFVAGKKVTGFSLEEDKGVEQAINGKLFNWYVEEALRGRGAKYVSGGPGADFAIADGNLITGQQQYSGRSAARLVLQQLAK